ncbi:MAG: hypothetical protein GX102_12710 [Porphyromonadaceae bacterium]|nr:hypothetical protein [Porphyromonadaceae bacterium]
MKKKNGFVVIFVVALLFTSTFYLVQAENQPINAADEIIPKVILLSDDQKVAAIVNGVAIPQKEYERLIINADILYRSQMLQFQEEKNSGKIGAAEYEARTAALEQFHNNPERNKNLLNTLIKDELLYQEARAKGYQSTLEQAKTYEERAFDILAPEQLQFLTQYAESLSMTYAEYSEAYLIPIRQKKMTSALLLTEYKDASLEEYQQMITDLFAKADIQILIITD